MSKKLFLEHKKPLSPKLENLEMGSKTTPLQTVTNTGYLYSIQYELTLSMKCFMAFQMYPYGVSAQNNITHLVPAMPD